MVALRPFVLYCYPSVLFGSLTYALAVVWLIVISETIGEILDIHLMVITSDGWVILYFAIYWWDFGFFDLWFII